AAPPLPARGPGRGAGAQAEACDSALLAGRARRALTALGVRPRPGPPPAPSMSMTEHHLLDMVGAGHSDRQIAQALLLTPQDVKALIGRVSRILGVSGRAEMADRAHRAATALPTRLRVAAPAPRD
ncbi:LuxR C-terminal-related transcriptional regulator, partial [Kitasatospora sp. NPDC048540]|uniref:LuxR C-terminal-related transcriptional regulator n=1 Tax=Kitasatospora sp. NPDC048540 TaxID=3155634 RepID=UPI0033C75F75